MPEGLGPPLLPANSINDWLMIDTQEPNKHKENLLEKILDHHHHKNGKEDQANDKSPHEGGLRSELKKDEAGFKKYIQEDEKLEEEGRTYGGLM
ncbi:uncharacterized protein N7506_005346 [Penicillium brevicompactum]|uniref:uncharacterized protein n=1 Tax=Penicillium brevicompactum TaxID=5074 RepID=UPI0025414C00|nr:uncharacterized protein N7506_005346 [Penicillium brevicompactum]KAJ5337324.1 hypothetical protein N7506_005346 [Penicillium brevicompactum]